MYRRRSKITMGYAKVRRRGAGDSVPKGEKCQYVDTRTNSLQPNSLLGSGAVTFLSVVSAHPPARHCPLGTG